MAKLVTLCGLLLVAAIVSAAPVAEENSAPVDITQLLEEANIEENDIFDPVTVAPIIVEESSTIALVSDQNKDGNKEVTEDETENNAVPLVALIDYADYTDKTMDEEKAKISNKTTIAIPEKEDDSETLIPVNEVIPEPEVAHVLGDAAELLIDEENDTVEKNIDNYQIVQRENEQGIPFISEYQPEIDIPTQEENSDEPVVETVSYEYPPDNINPEAVFRPEQIMDESDNVPVADNIAYNEYQPEIYIDNMGNIDDFSSYTLEEAINHDLMMSGDMLDSMNPMDTGMTDAMRFDEAVHNHDMMNGDKIDSMDYSNPIAHDFLDEFSYDSADFIPSTSFDESIHYDNPEDQPGPIVIGLNENYHPEPMPGLSLQPGEILENLEVDYPLYDEPIIPAAMMSFGPPAVEEPHFEDEFNNNQMPEKISMVDFPHPVAEFPVEHDPMASMQPMMETDMSHDDLFYPEMHENYIIDAPTDNSVTDLQIIPDDSTLNEDPDVLVIKLDVRNQEALVNGMPFTINRPSKLLGFVEQIINAVSKSPRLEVERPYSYGIFDSKPFYGDYDNDISPDMIMQDNSHHYGYESPQMYSSYMDEPNYDSYYQPSYSYDDYLPYSPFLSALRRRMTMSRYNRMRSFSNRFGYERTPQFHHRFDYNPYW